MPTPAIIIQVNDVSGYLAANAVSMGSLFSPFLNPKLPLILYMEGKALSWGNQYGTDDIQAVANYVYAMDYKSQYALRIVNGGGGGAVTPVNPGIPPPTPLDFKVSGATVIPTGSSSLVIGSFIGYNVDFYRNGVTQNTTDLGDGSSFYTWDITTGLFSMSSAAQAGELFRIVPFR